MSIPLKIDGVVIGVVSVDENGKLFGAITAPGTKPYLKELLLANMLDSITIEPDYKCDRPENLVPFPRNHLHLARGQ